LKARALKRFEDRFEQQARLVFEWIEVHGF
jgi:hypothetical protein